jgi:tetratricopeptide (TPR) repeat protein
MALLGVLLLLPATASAQANAADSAWVRGDRAHARRLYESRLAAHPTDATALLRLAILAGWEGERAQSLAYYDRLLHLAPGDREVIVARARTLATLGRFAEADAIVDSVLAAHPTDVAALQAAARFAAWDGDLGRSEDLLRTALAQDSLNNDTRAQLAQTLRWQGRVEAAYAVIRPALERGSPDEEVRVQHDHAAQSLKPHVRSIIGYEDDSDGNSITTLAVSAGTRLAMGVDVRADGYLRTAGLDATTAAAAARGIMTSLALHTTQGWLIEAGLGASTTDQANARTRAMLGATVSTPRRSRTALTFSAARSALDYTAPQVRNDVSATEGRMNVDVRASRDWTLAFNAGWTHYDARRTQEENRRLAAQAQVRRRLPDPFALILGVRTFGFDRDVGGGYFDPDFYGLADVTLAGLREGRHWTVEGEVAPGLQRIGREGDVTGALRAWAEVSWVLRPGRRIGVRGTYANTGLQQLAGAGSGYRYTSAQLNLQWWL